MRHRHLADDRLTAAAVDDIIARGKWDDWLRLRAQVRVDANVRNTVARVCAAYANDRSAQRQQFWSRYVERLA